MFIRFYIYTNTFVRKLEKQLHKINIVGAVLMDLLKEFDCIPHDLLIAKLNAYGFEEKRIRGVMVSALDFYLCVRGSIPRQVEMCT